MNRVMLSRVMCGKFYVLSTLFLLLTLTAVLPASADTVALVGATIHPVSGPTIEGGTLIIDGDRITSVGSDAVPAGTRVVDVAGKHIYPGFVHAWSLLGLAEISSVRGTMDIDEVGDNNADLRAEVAWNADSLRILPSVRGGVTTAHIYQRGGLFSGTTAAMRLEGWNWRDMALKAPLAMVLDFPMLAASDDEDGEDAAAESSEELTELDDLMARARAYAKASSAGKALGSQVGKNAKLEALAPMLNGELPLYVRANGHDQIAGALDWLKAQELEGAVLVSDYRVADLAERVAAAGIPVVLTGVLARPERDFESYDAVYRAASRLEQAGVLFAIADGGSDDDAANARNLPFHAAMAAAFGLSKTKALESVTLAPARILGVDDHVGSLEVGKEATLLITDGDPLEIMTSIEAVWIAGQPVALEEDHQYRLYEKYNNRPRPSAAARVDSD